MEYSTFPARAFIDEDAALIIQGIEQLADIWGLDLTSDLEHDQTIDEQMRGPDNV
tara:strand:- start:964 stop:1128 length:165 start_codon:yes stop_codon:yes gene_type:complete